MTLPHEREARRLAREHKWTWREIREVLVTLNGDVEAAKIALNNAAALNRPPIEAAMQLRSAMTR